MVLNELEQYRELVVVDVKNNIKEIADPPPAERLRKIPIWTKDYELAMTANKFINLTYIKVEDDEWHNAIMAHI